MYHTSVRTPISATHRAILQNALVHDFSTHVEAYALTHGCYPLAEPWYSTERIAILSTRVMDHTQLAAFEDDLHARIQQELPTLCAAV